MSRLSSLVTEIYTGSTPRAVRARYWLVAFDLAIILYFVISTFLPPYHWLVVADFVIGGILVFDFVARMSVQRDKIEFLIRPTTIIDIIVILSLFIPAMTGSFVFLRVLRALRLFRSYQVIRQLRSSSPFFARNQDVIFSALNLFVFIFVVTALVYELQVQANPSINNYIDALYFTITTLTTTGFGDITLVGSTGRLLAVVIMIVGVSLFIRLAQTIFRPSKVQYTCPDCGLTRHDPDAVHCKHCGRVLHIASEGV